MIIHIESIDDPALADFTSLTDVALRSSTEAKTGLYLAESMKVIARAVERGHQPRAFLLLEEWIPKCEHLFERFPNVPAYVGDTAQLAQLTGFHLHRGAIASMHRPAPLDPRDLLKDSRRIVVLDGLADHTNVGAIFRSVAGLGADAVLLTPDCADPLYRRAVRVSMGAVLHVPWARLDDWSVAGPMIRGSGFELVALGLNTGAEPLETFINHVPDRVAYVFGSEGPGLSRRALGASTRIVTIPMDHDVDSLNVATSAAIVLWATRARHTSPARDTDVNS